MGIAMVIAAMWTMAMVMRLVGNEEGKGKGSKGTVNGDEGGRR
jgi:hypothetical protein